MDNNIVHLTDPNFEQEVLKSTVPVLVDFHAVWCGPCKAMAPALEKVADKFIGKVKVAKLDIEEAEKTAEKYGVSTVPTLILFVEGQPKGSSVGAIPQTKIEELLSRSGVV
jgi:thioredoxin 1